MQEAGSGSRPRQIATAHKWIPVSLLDSLLRLTASDDARRTLSVDSTRYTFNRYVEVEDIRRGRFYLKTTVKHHARIRRMIGYLRSETPRLAIAGWIMQSKPV